MPQGESGTAVGAVGQIQVPGGDDVEFSTLLQLIHRYMESTPFLLTHPTVLFARDALQLLAVFQNARAVLRDDAAVEERAQTNQIFAVIC